MQLEPGWAQLGLDFVNVEVEQEGLVELGADVELQFLGVGQHELGFLHRCKFTMGPP